MEVAAQSPKKLVEALRQNQVEEPPVKPQQGQRGRTHRNHEKVFPRPEQHDRELRVLLVDVHQVEPGVVREVLPQDLDVDELRARKPGQPKGLVVRDHLAHQAMQRRLAVEPTFILLLSNFVSNTWLISGKL